MSLVRRIANLFRRSRMDREIDVELQSHIALRIEDNLARGMSGEEAGRDARLRFGNPVVIKERSPAPTPHWLWMASGAIFAMGSDN